MNYSFWLRNWVFDSTITEMRTGGGAGLGRKLRVLFGCIMLRSLLKRDV